MGENILKKHRKYDIIKISKNEVKSDGKET